MSSWSWCRNVCIIHDLGMNTFNSQFHSRTRNKCCKIRQVAPRAVILYNMCFIPPGISKIVEASARLETHFIVSSLLKIDIITLCFVLTFCWGDCKSQCQGLIRCQSIGVCVTYNALALIVITHSFYGSSPRSRAHDSSYKDEECFTKNLFHRLFYIR